MRRAFVAASRAAFNVIYRFSRKDKRPELAIFLSRQTNEPSYDFSELARELEARGWTCVMHLKKVRARNIVPYVAHVVREIRLLGRCQLAVLDRYDPVVSLLNFECEQAPSKAEGCVNTEFPCKPVVLQIWHAFGAFKKFGYQSVGTREGHSASFTDAYDIHRNYSWVLCSGEAARNAFAEAFSCPPERVVPLVRPEYDQLVAKRASRTFGLTDGEEKPSSKHQVRVLMAPTLRKSGESAHPFKELYAHRSQFEESLNAELCWSFHPLEQGQSAPGAVSDELLNTDVLVTDYSSIAYEAYVLGIPIFFYIPDIDAYRKSPGLNADPELLCSSLCARDEQTLVEKISRHIADSASYPQAEFKAFAASAFDDNLDSKKASAASRIVDFALSKLTGT